MSDIEFNPSVTSSPLPEEISWSQESIDQVETLSTGISHTQSLNTMPGVTHAEYKSQSVPINSDDFFTIEENRRLLIDNVTNGMTRHERCRLTSEVMADSQQPDIYD